AATAFPPEPGDLLISEFRNGGSSREFVEIYNNTDHDIVINAPGAPAGWNDQFGGSLPAGAAVVEEGSYGLIVIPNGTVIKARGHYLGTNWYNNQFTQTSVSTYAQLLLSASRTNGVVAWGYFDGHQTSVNKGLALFNSADPAFWTMANLLDAVGSTASASLYRSGTGLPVMSTTSAV